MNDARPDAARQTSGAAPHLEYQAPAGLPAVARQPTPSVTDPHSIRIWFDGLMDDDLPDADGTLETARRTAEALARRAKADNTRRAYRAGVRAWCAWCVRH